MIHQGPFGRILLRLQLLTTNTNKPQCGIRVLPVVFVWWCRVVPLAISVQCAMC